MNETQTEIATFDAKLDGYNEGAPKLVILGPPGCGKTRQALDAFIIPCLTDGGICLATSFSVAAANEMKMRCAAVLGCSPKSLDTVCSTIHSESLRQIRTLRQDWKLYDGVTRTIRSFKKDGAIEGNITPTMRKEREITLGVWDYCRAVMRDDDEDFVRETAARASAGNAITSAESIVADIAVYEEEKRQESALVDFTDMLTEAMYAPGRRLDLLLVDESQDCTKLQWACVSHWATMARKVVVIADVDQNVHSWAGSDATIVEECASSGDYEVRKLSKSWRVPRTAHRLARRIITQNHRKLDATYEPADNEGSVRAVDIGHVIDVAAKVVASKLDMLVLARAAKGLTRYATRLAEAGIPFTHERGPSPMGAGVQCKVMYALESLRENGEVGLYYARVMVKHLKVRGVSTFSGSTKSAVQDAMSEGDGESMISVGELKGHGCDMEGALGPGERYCAGNFVTGMTKGKELALISDRCGRDVLLEEPRVVLTTFHASKGREAVVVAVNAAMPVPAQIAYDRGQWEDVEAERRCLYVAVTRTKEALLIDTSSPQRPYTELL